MRLTFVMVCALPILAGGASASRTAGAQEPRTFTFESDRGMDGWKLPHDDTCCHAAIANVR